MMFNRAKTCNRKKHMALVQSGLTSGSMQETRSGAQIAIFRDRESSDEKLNKCSCLSLAESSYKKVSFQGYEARTILAAAATTHTGDLEGGRQSWLDVAANLGVLREEENVVNYREIWAVSFDGSATLCLTYLDPSSEMVIFHWPSPFQCVYGLRDSYPGFVGIELTT